MNITPTDATLINGIVSVFMIGMCYMRLVTIEREIKDIKEKKYPERIAKMEAEIKYLQSGKRH